MFLSNTAKKILFILWSILMPIEVWSAAEGMPTKDIEIRIDSSVGVGHEAVVLGNVATIYAKSMKDFNALSNLVISQIPEDSKEISIPSSYLQARIRQQLPPGTEFHLHAPPTIRFHLDKIGISTSELIQELLTKARAEGKIPEGIEPEVSILNGEGALKMLKREAVRLEAASEQNAWKGEVNFKLVSLDGTKEEKVYWIKTKFRWFAPIWVANKNIGLFQNLDSSMFTLTRSEISSLREQTAPRDFKELQALLQSSRAKRTITAHTPLTLPMIDRKPDIMPGQPLKVVFISESGIRVTADGAVIGSGSIGTEIRAKLKSSKKIVTGRLVEGGVMEVSL